MVMNGTYEGKVALVTGAARVGLHSAGICRGRSAVVLADVNEAAVLAGVI